MVICLQTHLDDRIKALDFFERDIQRKAAATTDRLNSEDEQLRIKEEHVAKVESLVNEEQMQVMYGRSLLHFAISP